MRFSDLSLVLQIVTALIAGWVTLVIVAIWIVNILEARSRRTAVIRAVRTILVLLPLWLVAEGYVAAITKWLSVRDELSLIGTGELLWALTPGLNILYGWVWLIDILRFDGKFIVALFGFPGG